MLPLWQMMANSSPVSEQGQKIKLQSIILTHWLLRPDFSLPQAAEFEVCFYFLLSHVACFVNCLLIMRSMTSWAELIAAAL